MSIIAAITLAVAIPLVAWLVRRRDKPTIPNNGILPVTASGLEEIGVKLSPAYPDRSWKEMILVNESDHYLIGVVMVYEFTMDNGEKGSVAHVLMRPEVSLETDPVKINAFLTKHRVIYPLIPPRSKWLVGFGVQSIRITNALLSFEEAQSFSSVEEDLATRPAIKDVHVHLDGVVLEDGQIRGPQTLNTRQMFIDHMPETNGGQK
jgi:hypothetical protein